MKAYPLTILLFLTLSATAQQAKVLHYDGDWKPAKPKNAAFLVEQKKNNDTCWEWNYYVAKGPRFLSIQFKDANGKIMHGDYRAYTNDGYVDTSGEYANGRRNGEWYVMASNHRTLYRHEYRDGALVSTKDSTQLNEERKRQIDSARAGKTDVVEIESEFKGGGKAWQQYLMRNLNYPKEAIDNNVQGVVHVQFVVNKDGKVEDVGLYKSAEYYIDVEAMRLIRDSPLWAPAVQDGRKVRSYKRQPITFRLR